MLSPEENLILLRSIRKIKYFSLCSTDQIKEMLPVFSKIEFEKGENIIREGEYGDFFFIVGGGKVSVWAEQNKKLAELGNGEFFGEIALIMDKPRNATVIAETHCTLFFLYRTDFLKLLDEMPVLRKLFFEKAAQRDKERKTLKKD